MNEIRLHDKIPALKQTLGKIEHTLNLCSLSDLCIFGMGTFSPYSFTW